MRLRQLSDLIADTRLRADVVGANVFITDTQVTEYINQGWARIYGTLTQSGEPYYQTQFLWTTTPNQDTYYTTAATGVPAGSNVLPTDMYRVRGLDAQVIQAPAYQACHRREFEQRNDFVQGGWSWPMTPLFEYQNSGNSAAIQLEPAPVAATAMRLWYYPAAIRMSNATDTIDGGNGWEIFAIDWAARRIAEHDENYELAQRIDQSLNEMDQRIKIEAANRIAGQAPKVRRVRYKRNGVGWGWPGRGSF